MDRAQLLKVMTSLLERARTYLKDEIGLDIAKAVPVVGDVEALHLREVTSIIGLGGPVRLMVAFSFDRPLIEHLSSIVTAGLDIAEDERDLFLRETAGEVVNFVLGHATADLAEQGQDVTLTPPVVIEEVRRIHRPQRAVFAMHEFTTPFGAVDINFIGPAELFDSRLRTLGGEEDTP